MKATRVREFIAAVAAICLILGFIAAIMHYMGKPVPIIGKLLGW